MRSSDHRCGAAFVGGSPVVALVAVVMTLAHGIAAPAASPAAASPVAASPATESRSAAATPGTGALAALREHLHRPVAERAPLAQAAFAGVPLTRAESDEAAALLWTDRVRQVDAAAGAAWREGRVRLAGGAEAGANADTMRLLVRRFGDAPVGHRSLWISLHGGGGTRPEINDQQWRNQIELYEPAEGIVVAPRALQDTWDLWHEPRIDRFIDRIVELAVALEGVDPDRVFLLGYSAGGDGVYRLAPRMADRFAAASMMAGHPGDADPRGLRNLPFALQVGGRDTAYERHLRAREWGDRLAELRAADPAGYPHLVRIHEDLGHWMQLRDAFVLEWMARHQRIAWPTTLVWVQQGPPAVRFGWLGVPEGVWRPGATVVAERVRQRGRRGESAPDGGAPGGSATGERRPGGTAPAPLHRIEVLESDPDELVLWLHDTLVDLDRPVLVVSGERVLHEAVVPRTIATLAESLALRADPRLMAPARVQVRVREGEQNREEPAAGSGEERFDGAVTAGDAERHSASE